MPRIPQQPTVRRKIFDMEFQFLHPQNPDIIRHQCTSERDGDWVIFRCKHCPSFERRVNLKSGEATQKSCGNPAVRHDGNYCPEVLRGMNMSMN